MINMQHSSKMNCSTAEQIKVCKVEHEVLFFCKSCSTLYCGTCSTRYHRGDMKLHDVEEINEVAAKLEVERKLYIEELHQLDQNLLDSGENIKILLQTADDLVIEFLARLQQSLQNSSLFANKKKIKQARTKLAEALTNGSKDSPIEPELSFVDKFALLGRIKQAIIDGNNMHTLLEPGVFDIDSLFRDAAQFVIDSQKYQKKKGTNPIIFLMFLQSDLS